eukprot:GHVP01066662.1.p2 GENE.GHVP01066662.1~~GHVP01066662.1.p2  ORF type:complete len:545 (-),score=104.48 GHVP01066662.1:2598-4232(-)
MENTDKQIESLKTKAEEWAQKPLKEKLGYIDALITNIDRHKKDLSAAGRQRRKYTTSYRGIQADAMAFLGLTVYLHSIRTVWESHKYNSLVKGIKSGEDDIFEFTAMGLEMKMLSGFATFGLHIPTPKSGLRQDIEIEKPWERPGGVCCVLAASNHEVLFDLLSALFIQNKVCILKTAPLCQGFDDLFAQIFEPLIAPGYMQIAEGSSVEIGKHIIEHPDVSLWVMTGALSTARKIFDSGSEEFKKKDCIIELGCCTPCIIVPDEWSSSNTKSHAQFLSWLVSFNGGHVCAHPQVVLTCKNWSHRESFLKELRTEISALEDSGEFYPDSEKWKLDTEEILKDAHPDCKDLRVYLDEEKKGYVILGEGFDKENCPLLTKEAFCSAVVEVTIDCPIEDFCREATKLLNSEKSYGTLSCMVVSKDPKRDDVATMVKDLKYGCVAINTAPMQCCFFSFLPWGGHAGTGTIEDLQSGFGYLGNSLGIKNLSKGIITCSFDGIHLSANSSKKTKQMSKAFSRLSSDLASTNFFSRTFHRAAAVSAFGGIL